MEDAALYGRLFALLGNMYLCKPTRETLSRWRELLVDDPIPGTEELCEAVTAINLDSEQELEDILWEYTRLFIGPDRLPCPPFESVYTSPKRLMMQDAYDQVQQLYAKVGVEMGNDDVMPDHIGAELNFLSVLHYKMGTGSEKLPLYSRVAADFLTSHLQNWVLRFTADMEESSESNLYRALARLTRQAVTS